MSRRWVHRNSRVRDLPNGGRQKPINYGKERTTHLTAEAYHAKYLIGGNAYHSRFLHYVRLRKRESQS
jgi:hypothetical protein